MEYNLSLESSPDHVAFCVTDNLQNIIKRSGKALWGTRSFDAANTAEERRLHRSSSRNNARKRLRIRKLQEFFEPAITEIDETFFIRCNESEKQSDDKSFDWKYPLFNDADYTDASYYKEYPTIYHLIKELITSDKPQDPRKVYLAIEYILKHRGHFNIPGSISDIDDIRSILEKTLSVFNELTVYSLSIEDYDAVKDILKEKKMANNEKLRKLQPLFKYEGGEQKEVKNAIKAFCKLIIGGTGDIAAIFPNVFDSETQTKICYGDAKYEEELLPELDDDYPEYASAVNQAKSIYDWSQLSTILNGEQYLSFAKVNVYEKHKRDLALLKQIIRTYCTSDTYRAFFRGSGKNNISYATYVGQEKGKSIKKCSSDDFFKHLASVLETISPSDTNKKNTPKTLKNITNQIPVTIKDKETIEAIKDEIEYGLFLPVQQTSENRFIPNQLHAQELSMILNNAKKYLPFLNEKDEYGTVADKIYTLATFRRPYYVGPLGAHAKNGWMVRKENGYITEWNFNEKIDIIKTRENFIKNMTRKCTYLRTEDVLPKCSLLYEDYMMLNQLNVLKVKGKAISVKEKQDLYNYVCRQQDTVTPSRITNFLKKNHPGITTEDIGGIDKNYKGSLKSYRSFAKILGAEKLDDPKYRNIIEDIILVLTIFHNDSLQIREIIKEKYAELFTETEIIKISRLQCTGWGTLSKNLLDGIKGANADTGEYFTIIKGLWDTENNFMQLLSKQYTFFDEIEAINKELVPDNLTITYENIMEDRYLAPSVKRSVWNAVKISTEITKIMKTPPKQIYIKVYRGNKSAGRAKSRKNELLDLYKKIAKTEKTDWITMIDSIPESRFNDGRIYLYFLQKGRCMYSGEEIPFEEIEANSPKWDRDHIYPKSRFINESISNLVLVDHELNRDKGSFLLSPDIQDKMLPFWKELLKQGFLKKEKFDKLTRRDPFTEDELSGFLTKQLVEQRQSSKAIADIFREIYTETDIQYVKAELLSSFTNDYNILLSPMISTAFFAKEAYLIGVVGFVYNSKYTSNPQKWFKKHPDYNRSIRKVFNYDVERDGEIVWHGEDGSSLKKVKKNLNRNDILLSESCYCEKGKMFDDNLSKLGNTFMIPRKKGMDTEKYGGYGTVKTACFAVISCIEKGERVKKIVGIPIYIHKNSYGKTEPIIQYLTDFKMLKDVEVIRYPVRKNTLFTINGYPARIRGISGSNITFKNALDLVLSGKSYETACHVCRYLAKKQRLSTPKYTYEPVEKYDRFNDNDLNELYDDLLYKLQTSLFSKRPRNQADVIERGRDIFRKMKKQSDKAVLLNEILKLFRCGPSDLANLTAIGGPKSAGTISMTLNTLMKCKLCIIDQSVTGFLERKTIL